MRPFRSVTGVAVPFGMKNVDTDIIIPAKWLKTISRSGLGKGAFEALRASPGNIFDTPRNAGAPILIAGENFGCGSSREHAPWALIDMGFRVIIAPGFADIFSGNSAKNGLLLVSLPQDAVDRLMEIAPQVELTVDLERQLVTSPLHDSFSFEIDPFRRHCLLEGLDEIGITETMADDITRYEQRLRQNRAWIFAQ